MYKERADVLLKANETLQQQCAQQELDAVEVIAALRDDIARKDEELENSLSKMDNQRGEFQREKRDLIRQYEKQIEGFVIIILGWCDAMILIEQRFYPVVLKKRFDLQNELDAQKSRTSELDKRYKEIIIQMERKFYEERVRFQKETNQKLEEFAANAHKEAVLSLDETTKHIYKENIRLNETLKSNSAAQQELARTNEDLAKANKLLSDDKEMNDAIVKDKIVKGRSQSQLIKDLQSKITHLERSLSQVVREHKKEREMLSTKATQEMHEIKRVAAQLKINLDRKTEEMKYIKQLANHVLAQRTDVEKFFMDALDYVREEIRHERERRRKEALKEFNRRLREANSTTTQSPFDILKNRCNQRNKLTDIQKYLTDDPISADTSNDDNKRHSTQQEQQNGGTQSKDPRIYSDEADSQNDKSKEKIDVSSLTWEEKEKVLRALFARMNGVFGAESGLEATRKSQFVHQGEECAVNGGGENANPDSSSRDEDIQGSEMKENPRIQQVGNVNLETKCVEPKVDAHYRENPGSREAEEQGQLNNQSLEAVDAMGFQMNSMNSSSDGLKT
ncbi:hypothetical protein BKA69DRAFT_1037173 [Paraphysoderma sedebokerense]|nr:hypothetical protein BKA69DRAFT_1037173 [Paraphysoderma sedebokerense]